jgi:hypothetical protein
MIVERTGTQALVRAIKVGQIRNMRSEKEERAERKPKKRRKGKKQGHRERYYEQQPSYSGHGHHTASLI